MRAVHFGFLGLLVAGCSDIAATNPWDPEAPPGQQAPAAINGQVRLLKFGDGEATGDALVELRARSGGEPIARVHPDARGDFGLTAPAGDWSVTVSATGYEAAERPFSAAIGEVVGLGVIGLRHESDGLGAVPFAGTVTLQGERHFDGTTVRLFVSGRDRAFASLTTDEAGRFEVRASRHERYVLVVEREGFRNPAPAPRYAFETVEAEPAGGHFTAEGGDGGPVRIELLPYRPPVCEDGDVGPCAESYGACVGALRTCVAGRWEDCPARMTERCDGLDEDCDGAVDEDLSGSGTPCTLPDAASVCAGGTCVVLQCLGDAVDVDGRPDDGCECIPSGAEGPRCDGLDQDCDGATDEDVDLRTDPENCGACENPCGLPNARTVCVEAICRLFACENGFHDFDGDPDTGCEAACTVTEGGLELCDGVDNDCDGRADEDHLPLDENIVHCGACGNDCRRLPHGAFGCEAGACVVLTCEPGFRDADGEAQSGCEYACTVTAGGTELCDGLDNDCDRRTDEDTDLLHDLRDCGVCGHACNLPNAAVACVAGECVVDACDPGWSDANGLPVDGCEARCEGATERCNGRDDDCDGATDEDFVELGTPCVDGLGACHVFGTWACRGDGNGARCDVALPEPQPEICNGEDDDCDGVVDDGFDADGDGYAACGGDCDDGDPGVRPGARETCDQVDQDCDGASDESFDLAADPENCGVCARSCQAAGAVTACVGGDCIIDWCADGLHDADGRFETGCEYVCTPDGAERCEGTDQDCDGRVDEGLGLGEVCVAPGVCGAGVNECRAGGGVGCSTAPGGSADASGPETCDDQDDDCDGRFDETFDLLTDEVNCGRCGAVCELSGAVAACEAGRCTLSTCLSGFGDLDPLRPGCEYACRPSVLPVEACDQRDNDCDGAVDEGFPIGEDCVSPGRCGAGELVCGRAGGVVCSSAPGGPADRSQVETCNREDDDCDGRLDEAVPTALLASDPNNCGACEQTCVAPPGALALCRGGGCDFGCAPGFIDADRDPGNGCETACVPGVPIVVQVPTFAAINAALRDAGACALVELPAGRIEGVAGGGADERTIVVDVPGLTLRSGAAGRALLVPPLGGLGLSVEADGVTVEGIDFELNNAQAIEAVEVLAPVVSDVHLSRVLYGPEDPAPPTFAAVRLVGTDGARIEGLRSSLADVQSMAIDAQTPGAPRPGLCLVRLERTRGSRLRGLLLNTRFLHGGPGSGLIVLDEALDTVIEDSELHLGFAFEVGDDVFGGVAAHAIALYASDRTLIRRTDFVGSGLLGLGGEAGYVGVRLDGHANRVEHCRFGVGLPGASSPQCPAGAVTLTNPREAVVENCTYQGLPFGVTNAPGRQTLEGLSLRYPASPTNYGAWVFAGGTGVEIRDNDLGIDINESCAGPGGPNRLHVDAGLVAVIDATEVVIEDNRFDQSYAGDSYGCGPASAALVNVRGAVIRRNQSFPGDVLYPPNTNSERCFLFGSYGSKDAGVAYTIDGGERIHLQDVELIPGKLQFNSIEPIGQWVAVRDTQAFSMEGSAERTLLYLQSTQSATVSGGRFGAIETAGSTATQLAGIDADSVHVVGDTGLQLLGARVRDGIWVEGDGPVEIRDADVGAKPCADGGVGPRSAALSLQGRQAVITGSRFCGTSAVYLEAVPVELSHARLEATHEALDLWVRQPLTFSHLTLRGAGPSATAVGVHNGNVRLDLTDSVLDAFPRTFVDVARGALTGALRYTALSRLGEGPPAAVTRGEGVLEVDCRLDADLRLGPGSPCIDAGDPDAPFDLEPAPNGGRINLGAFGGTAAAEPSAQ
jgi:hypothetical protein